MLGRDLLMANMNRRNDSTKQNLNQRSYRHLTIVFYTKFSKNPLKAETKEEQDQCNTICQHTELAKYTFLVDYGAL